jgi:hypothetical protein
MIIEMDTGFSTEKRATFTVYLGGLGPCWGQKDQKRERLLGDIH